MCPLKYNNFIDLPSDLVEEKILTELNKIMEPDCKFNRIVVQKLNNGNWELFLEEKDKGRIALSQSGSGLKTIFLVLIYLYLIPYEEGDQLKSYIFGFEELENNIHPALQRRLFLYLKDISSGYNCRFFITTHSNVIIDLFSNDKDAQIIHVLHNGIEASTKVVKAYVERQGILDDLDVRASDLLQSNGVIWVEGPSDRLYVNHWISLWSDGTLKEGHHYQCVFYGGRLLSHLTADLSDDMQNDLIRIFLVNRNTIILIDSDKKSESHEINQTKLRIKEEMEKNNGLCWITKGREIENYIPKTSIESFYEKSVNDSFDQYSAISDFLNNFDISEGNKFLCNKVIFAEKIKPYLKKNLLMPIYDLDEKINIVCEQIKMWNGI